MIGDVAYTPQTIVALVFKRLSDRLPATTGSSIEDVESSSIYSTSRDFLLSTVGKGLFSDVLYGAVLVMDDLVENLESCPSNAASSSSLGGGGFETGGNSYFVPHSYEAIHASLVVLTRLLAMLSVAEWDESRNSSNRAYVPPIGNKQKKYGSDVDIMFQGKTKFYTTSPAPCDAGVASAMLQVILRIKSDYKVHYALKNMMDVPADCGAYGKDLPSQLDENCEIILFFLSASNWPQVYQILHETFRSLKYHHNHNDNNSNSNNSSSGEIYNNTIHPTNTNLPAEYHNSNQSHSSGDAYSQSILSHHNSIHNISHSSSSSSSNNNNTNTYSTNTTSSHNSDFVRNIDLLGSLFLDYDKLITLLREIQTTFTVLKRSMHKLLIEFFFKQSLLYWTISHGSEVVFCSQSNSDLMMEASTLFDLVTRNSDHERKSHVYWEFLATLSVLLPEAFCKDAKFKKSRMMSKKITFLETLNKHFRKPTNNKERENATSSYIIMVLSAAMVSQSDPNHPLVTFAYSMYRDLLDMLYGSSDRPRLFYGLDRLQSLFVSAYSYLNYNELVENLVPVIRAPTAPPRYQRNIIRGFLNLHTMPDGHGILYDLLESSGESLLGFIAMLSRRCRDYQQGFAKNDNFGFDVHIHAIKLSFLLTMTEPMLYFRQHEISDHESITGGFVEACAYGTVCSDIPLRETVINFLFDLAESPKLYSFGLRDVQNNPKHIVHFLYRKFGRNAKDVATDLLGGDLNDPYLERQLLFMKKFLEMRYEFITHYQYKEKFGDNLSPIESPEDRELVSGTIETAVLASLCSNNTETCKAALSVLQAMLNEAVSIENFDRITESHWSILPNFEAYSEISNPKFVVTGPVVIQKKMYKWLQLIEDPSPAMVKAWTLIYDRWIVINVNSFSVHDKQSLERQREWKSYAGFLCSLLAPLLNLDGNVKIPDNAHFKARQFLGELIEYLLYDSPFVRETVKEVLARESSPFVFHHVFQKLNEMVDERLTPECQLEPRDLSLAAQTTTLMTSVIQRLHEGDVYLSIDIGSLALKILRFLRGLESNTDTLKLDIKVCNLVGVIGYYKDTLNVKHEVRIRNEFVMILAEWLEKTTSHQSSNTIENKSSNRTLFDKERLIKEKSVAIVKSLNQLLDGLPIDIDETKETDVLATKANVFSHLFSLFLRVLYRCKVEEEGSKANGGGLLLMTDKIPYIRNQTILALTHLLIANVDVGLRTALALGYHEDYNLRQAFLEIFKNILSQGTKFSEEYNENKRYEELVELIVNHPTISRILCDICPPSEVDDFSLALLNVYDSRGKSLSLVKEVVIREIEHSDSGTDVLRRNCVATKILSLYAKTKGYHYLQDTLGPFLKNMVGNPTNYIFELEPEKVKDYDEFKENLEHFERCITELTQSLENNMDRMPCVFREVCSTIQTTVSKKFPEAKESAVSAFFFLRYICPALVSPDTEGLLDKPPQPDVRRSLLLLAKVIQNMANGSNNPARLSLVSDRISMIEQKTEIILKILKDIPELGAECSYSTEDKQMPPASIKSLERPYAVALHKFLYNHWEDAHQRLLMERRMRRLMRSKLLTSSPSLRESSPFHGNGTVASSSHGSDDHANDCENKVDPTEEAEATRRLITLIRSLGKPATSYSRHMQPYMRFRIPTRLYEFMSRNSIRDIDQVIEKRPVHEGISNDGTPVLVINIKNMDVEQVDPELILYYFFQVASKMWTDKFYLFYDGTGFTPSNAFPAAAREASQLMIPDEMAHNCVAVYFYNIGSNNLKRLSKIMNTYRSGFYLNPRRTNYYLLTSENITSHFSVHSLNLEERSKQLTTDVKFTYPDVRMVYEDGDEPGNVTIKIGAEYLQVMCSDEVVLSGAKGYVNDTYHYSEIANAYVPADGITGEFVIELKTGTKVIFYGERCGDIVRAILSAKGNVSEREAERKENSVVMKVDDALPTLFNMGLANLCSKNEALQQAAYNLLATLPARFNIDFNRELNGGPGLAIPKNELTMAVSFSETVAASHPHMTYDFLLEFFNSYRSFGSDSRQSSVLYIVPWVKNIYEYVFMADEEKGAEKTATIIRHCVEMTAQNSEEYSFMSLNIWPILCLEDSLSDVIVDEVVRYIVERGLGYEDMENPLAIITSFPTVSLCGTVISRIRDFLAKPMGTENKSISCHPNWKEIEVLVKTLSYLTFDSLLIVEVFLPEIFYLITTFIYTGSSEFRQSLHGILVNVTHSFTSSPKLNAEKKDHLNNIWNELNSARGRLLFGLSDEMKMLSSNKFMLSAVKHIENCAYLLLDLLATVGQPDEGNTWRARWGTFVLKSCFIESLALQCRSFVILGCLAKIEVEDLIVTQVLSVLKDSLTSERQVLNEEYAACTLFCLTKMVEGLPANSKYHAKLFWLALSVLKTGSLTLFSYSLNLVQECLRVLDELGTFKSVGIAEYMMQGREFMEDEWRKIDGMTKVKFSVEFFDLALCASVLRGLEKSATRSSTLKALEIFMEISSKNNVKDNDSTRRYPQYLSYLYFLFLGCRGQESMRDLLWVAGYPEDHVDNTEKADAVPSLLQAFLADDSPDSTITLFLGGHIFQSCEYENMDQRFLDTLQCVMDAEKRVMVYSVIRPKLIRLLEQGNTSGRLEPVLSLASSILDRVDLFANLAEYRKGMQELLISKGFEGLLNDQDGSKSSVFDNHPTSEHTEEQRINQEKFASLLENIIMKRGK